jgi:hypothetical protein
MRFNKGEDADILDGAKSDGKTDPDALATANQLSPDPIGAHKAGLWCRDGCRDPDLADRWVIANAFRDPCDS